MLALLSLPVPLPANPPRRLPVMRDFWQRWTNLALPPATRHPKASLPAPTISANGMTTEVRTNLGPPATSPTDARRNTHRLVTPSGHGDNLLPDVQTHLGPPPAPPTDGPQTPQSLAAHFGLFRRCHDHRCRNKTRASSNRRRRTIIGLSAASTHLGPRRQSATSTSRHTSGLRHFHQQTVQGLAAHFGHFPAKATTCHLDVQTHLGPSPFSPADGPGARCPLRSSSGLGGNLPPRRPDTPRAAAIFTSRRISGALPPTCPPPTGRNPMPPLLPLLPLSANPGSVPRQDAPLPS